MPQAATELFQLQMENIKTLDAADRQKEKQLNALRAEATLEMAQMVAHYVKEQGDNVEEDNLRREKVAATERRKEHQAHPGNPLASVSELYDTIIWSVATSGLGWSTTGSSIYTDSTFEYDGDEGDEEVSSFIDALVGVFME